MTPRAAAILTTMILITIKEYVTDSVSKSGLTGRSIRAIGWKTELKERAFSGTQMGTFLKANSKTTSQTVTEYIHVLMGPNTRECGLTIFSMVRAQPRGLMGRPTPATTLREKSTGLAPTNGPREIPTLENGLKIKLTGLASTSGRTVEGTRATG